MIYSFERDTRTAQSEAYSIELDGEAGGRVDIHFSVNGAVHATLCVPAHFEDPEIEDLIAEIDERLVLNAEPYRDDFIVTVWRGTFAGIYSEEDDDDDDEDEGDESGNGHRTAPVA